MEKIVIIRYAEIHLKGKNRGYFERVFSVNLERALRGLRHELRRTSGRYLVEAFDEEELDEICGGDFPSGKISRACRGHV